MECIKWEQQGLLYSSGELTETEKHDYEEHLSQCIVCRDELDTYQTQKSTLFTQFLAEPTTPDLDALVYKRCAHKLHTSPFLFSTVIKKTVLSAFFLGLGFAGTGYFVYVKNDAKRSAIQAARTPEIRETTPAAVPESPDEPLMVAVDDSVKSGPDSSQRKPFSETLGKISARGVTTVDVKQE